jgi:hypothetical protein
LYRLADLAELEQTTVGRHIYQLAVGGCGHLAGGWEMFAM